MGGWARMGVHLKSFYIPTEQMPAEMPGWVLEMLRAVEEFRVATKRATEDAWAASSPRLPLTKAEVRGVIRGQMERDELTVLRQLARLGSMSAEIIALSQLTREIYKEALDALQHDRAAQIALASVLSANRFRAHYQGRVLRSESGGCRRVAASLAHML